MNALVAAQYPRAADLIASGFFPADHYANNLALTDPIIPALDYFLSLDGVPGHQERLRLLQRRGTGKASRNNRRVEWASVCAELGAIRLLGHELAVSIVGFDVVAPNTKRPQADCDIVIDVGGEKRFVEVKRNAAEDKQTLPEDVEAWLRSLVLPFSVSAELGDRSYDSAGLDEFARRVEEYVREHELGAPRGVAPSKPMPLDLGPLIINFHDKGLVTSGTFTGFSPVFADDLEPYLLGPARQGSSGTLMRPMVEQAVEKGADYLACRVTNWEGWVELIDHCFRSTTPLGQRAYLTSDPRLQGLQGLVLFSRYDDFVIIEAKAGDKLLAGLAQP